MDARHSIDCTFPSDPQPMARLFKHSSVYDASTRSVWVYGGYTPRLDLLSGTVEDSLFQYDVDAGCW